MNATQSGEMQSAMSARRQSSISSANTTSVSEMPSIQTSISAEPTSSLACCTSLSTRETIAPVFTACAAMAPTANTFAAYEILVSALLGGSVSSAIVLLSEELPVKQRARGQAAAALASAIGGVLGYLIIPVLLAWNYSWRWLLAPSVAGILLAPLVAAMLPAQSRWSTAASSGTAKRSHFYDIFHRIHRR